MIIYDLPPVLRRTSERWHLDARTRSGGETIGGREQVVSSGLSRWLATVPIECHDRGTVWAARALVTRLDGRANAIRIGPCDCRNAPIVLPLVDGIPYSDLMLHSDGTGFSQGGLPAFVAVSAAVGATTVVIDLGSTVELGEGVYIGLAGYLYLVVGVTVLPFGRAELQIRPKLRAAPAVGQVIDWCHPTVPMRLANDSAGALDLMLARLGTCTLDLVEVW